MDQDMKKKRSTANNYIGRNIRSIRLRQGETQQQLGEAIGYGATTVANYESGLRYPDIETLQDIADHYDVDITELVKGRFP